MENNSQNPDPPDPPQTLNYQTPALPEALVRVRLFSSAMEANLARLKLEDEGIRSTIAGENLAAGLGIYGAPSGQIDLMVPESDAETARRILDEIDARRARRSDAEAAKLACPRCGNMNSRGFSPRHFLLAGVLFVVAMILNWQRLPGPCFVLIVTSVALLLLGGWRRSCRVCGKTWPAPSTDVELDDDEPTDEA